MPASRRCRRGCGTASLSSWSPTHWTPAYAAGGDHGQNADWLGLLTRLRGDRLRWMGHAVVWAWQGARRSCCSTGTRRGVRDSQCSSDRANAACFATSPISGVAAAEQASRAIGLCGNSTRRRISGIGGNRAARRLELGCRSTHRLPLCAQAFGKAMIERGRYRAPASIAGSSAKVLAPTASARPAC
jgi:hypothetical protein